MALSLVVYTKLGFLPLQHVGRDMFMFAKLQASRDRAHHQEDNGGELLATLPPPYASMLDIHHYHLLFPVP
jgi:hypothetical protein